MTEFKWYDPILAFALYLLCLAFLIFIINEIMKYIYD